MESRLSEEASLQVDRSAVPALSEAVQAKDLPVRRAKRARSPQRRGKASCNEVRPARNAFCSYTHKKTERLREERPERSAFHRLACIFTPCLHFLVRQGELEGVLCRGKGCTSGIR